MVDQEFEDFKTRIDLRQYAAVQGYSLDLGECWKTCDVMRDGRGDKIFVQRDGDGHWIYHSFHEVPNPRKRNSGAAGGTIIDFIQVRKGLSFGQIRQELRPWIGKASPALPRFAPLPPFHSSPDRERVQAEFRRMAVAVRHAWLEEFRRIPPALLSSPRFAGRVRVDGRGNAVFPHFDDWGLCGFEKKNQGFTGFASGGTKGLWQSHERPEDTGLVIAESAIDALSYAALFPDDRARYCSIGGQVNAQQPALLRAAVLDLPAGASVIAAMDNDAAGHQLAEVAGTAITTAARPDISFRVHLPPVTGTDWNDVLKAKLFLNLPAVRL